MTAYNQQQHMNRYSRVLTDDNTLQICTKIVKYVT